MDENGKMILVGTVDDKSGNIVASWDVTSVDTWLSRLNKRVSDLEQEVNTEPTPDVDEGEYYIRIFNNTKDDLVLTASVTEGGGFKEDGSWVSSIDISLPYCGKGFGDLFMAGTSSTALSLTSSDGKWDEDITVSKFLQLRDVDGGGNATNYVTMHLCPDGSILSKAEYDEAYV